MDLYTTWLEQMGFNQSYELDLDVTYGPVGKIDIVHMQIGLTSGKGGGFK